MTDLATAEIPFNTKNFPRLLAVKYYIYPFIFTLNTLPKIFLARSESNIIFVFAGFFFFFGGGGWWWGVCFFIPTFLLLNTLQKFPQSLGWLGLKY